MCKYVNDGIMCTKMVERKESNMAYEYERKETNENSADFLTTVDL